MKTGKTNKKDKCAGLQLFCSLCCWREWPLAIRLFYRMSLGQGGKSQQSWIPAQLSCQSLNQFSQHWGGQRQRRFKKKVAPLSFQMSPAGRSYLTGDLWLTSPACSPLYKVGTSLPRACDLEKSIFFPSFAQRNFSYVHKCRRSCHVQRSVKLKRKLQDVSFVQNLSHSFHIPWRRRRFILPIYSKNYWSGHQMGIEAGGGEVAAE